MSINNGDPDFNKVLDKINMNTPKQRKMLFYFVCIWVRFALYSLVFYFKDNIYMPYILLLISLFSIANLSKTLNQTQQWWSKKFQFIISVLLFISCLLVIFYKINPVVMPLILYISLIGGITQSLFIEFK